MENPCETLPPAPQKAQDRLPRRLRQLLRKDDFSEQEVIEYIQIHVPTINKQNIRALTRTMIETTLDEHIQKGIKHYTLHEQSHKNCLEVLRVFIHGEDKLELQLEALYAIQFLSNDREHPKGITYYIYII